MNSITGDVLGSLTEKLQMLAAAWEKRRAEGRMRGMNEDDEVMDDNTSIHPCQYRSGK